MLYHLTRWLAGIALCWFYREIAIVGRERIPETGPLLLAVNHPNALVDALMVLHLVDRRITLTAKATLFETPALARIMRALGIVPLRRASDEARHDPSHMVDPARNAAAFESLLDALASGAAVLLFPEGKSHSAPELAPLRTGLARIALRAREERGLHSLPIVPIGLTFEAKWRPRTRVFAHVGEPVLVEAVSSGGNEDIRELTARIDRALRRTTLNFASADEAASMIATAHILSSAGGPARSLATAEPPLATEVEIVRRVQAARAVLGSAEPELTAAFTQRLDLLETELAARGIAPGDIAIDAAAAPGVRFAIREGAIVAIPGVAALWGRVNHAVPLTLARWMAHRVSRAPDDPAMYTITIALALILVAYSVQTALVWHVAGTIWALLYLASLPPSGLWNERFRDRLRRARQRIHTYLLFRRHPELQAHLLAEVQWLRAEGERLEQLARGESGVRRQSAGGPAGPVRM